MIKIMFVCHGNICRSPMAEFVMKDLTVKAGVDAYIASAATSTEEIGNPVHRGTKKKLLEVGILTDGKYAVQLTRADYNKYDYIIGMDSVNIRRILQIVGEDKDGKVFKLLSFDDSEKDIADPWYTGNFDETYDDVLRGCTALLRKITEE
ncbi:MAG: low molecular weight phosphotyrosine protein phosphatase [Ruminococcaceae bacterium]|nr:low molecular weight phosphotyrosine protein phosphatase [Oscillospiraceae bacterium]